VSQEQHGRPPLPPQELFDLLHGHWAARAIQVATTLGVPDALKDGPKSVEELARITETHPPSLYRLLRALASVGVFTEVEPQHFAHSEFSRFLQSSQPISLYNLARMMDAHWHWRVWGEMEQSIRTGKPVFERLYGTDRWSYFQQHPEEWKIFDAGISNFSRLVDRAITGAYDFSGVQTVVDVAGGHGSLLIALLSDNPTLQGVLFDQAEVLEGARPFVSGAGLDERCQLVSGDMFATVPAGADVYLLKEIIHNWDDTHAIQILRNCRQAVKPDGKVLVADNLIRPGGKETSFAKFLDLEMLMGFIGKERTAEEFQALLAESGFKMKRIIPTQSPLVLIEGIVA
jgi:SAM-dependent methyltransferase